MKKKLKTIVRANYHTMQFNILRNQGCPLKECRSIATNRTLEASLDYMIDRLYPESFYVEGLLREEKKNETLDTTSKDFCNHPRCGGIYEIPTLQDSWEGNKFCNICRSKK